MIAALVITANKLTLRSFKIKDRKYLIKNVNVSIVMKKDTWLKILGLRNQLRNKQRRNQRNVLNPLSTASSPIFVNHTNQRSVKSRCFSENNQSGSQCFDEQQKVECEECFSFSSANNNSIYNLVLDCEATSHERKFCIENDKKINGKNN